MSHPGSCKRYACFLPDEDCPDTEMLQDLIKETEDLLEKWKHPEPYRPPTAPGGESVITRIEVCSDKKL